MMFLSLRSTAGPSPRAAPLSQARPVPFDGGVWQSRRWPVDDQEEMAMPLRDRVHPDVQEGLEGFFAVVGPGGLRAIEDIPARREKAAEMFEAMAAAMPPNERVEHE